MDYGVKVTEVGFDVEDADLENILFHSSYPFFKIYSDSIAYLTVALNSNASYTFVHGLGYVPAFIMYSTPYVGDNFSRALPQGVSPQPFFSTAYADNTKVEFIYRRAAGIQFSITIRCIIFLDKIST